MYYFHQSLLYFHNQKVNLILWFKIHRSVPPSRVKFYWKPSFSIVISTLYLCLLHLLFWPTYGYSLSAPSTNIWEKKMADSIISPSDGNTSEEEEYTRIMYTNNPTVVETVNETSNSSNHDYTLLVSVSFTNAGKYHTCLSFYTIWILPNII